jgi:uncharacterized OsmC-like protein
MHPYPHVYAVSTLARSDGPVLLRADDLADIPSLPPEQFGGPGDHWSPETLLVAAVADCLVLTFRAIARASNLPWEALECECEGTLDRDGGVTRFTRFDIDARLILPPGGDEHKALRLLEKAKAVCLVTNSLNAESRLNPTVSTAD